MKVYLATSGSYSSYQVRGVFVRKEDAEAYELGDDVEEYELHEGPQEVRSWHTLTWFPDLPEPEYETDSYTLGKYKTPNPYEGAPAERRHYDGHINQVEHRWRDAGRAHIGALEVSGWDIDRVRKVFGELRAEWLNCKALGMVWDKERFQWAAPEDDVPDLETVP